MPYLGPCRDALSEHPLAAGFGFCSFGGVRLFGVESNHQNMKFLRLSFYLMSLYDRTVTKNRANTGPQIGTGIPLIFEYVFPKVGLNRVGSILIG